MSSQFGCDAYCYNGSKVVDGIYLPPGADDRISVAHTRHEVNSYIQIDLEVSRCITAVKIWNRVSESESHTTNFFHFLHFFYNFFSNDSMTEKNQFNKAII